MRDGMDVCGMHIYRLSKMSLVVQGDDDTSNVSSSRRFLLEIFTVTKLSIPEDNNRQATAFIQIKKTMTTDCLYIQGRLWLRTTLKTAECRFCKIINYHQ